MDENPAALAGTALAFQREIQGKLPIQPAHVILVADQQIVRVALAQFNGERFERNFRTDAGDVTQ
jgi:hypothetical protein